MNVDQLLAILRNCDPKALVVLAADTEGNRFSPLYGWGETKYHDGDICDDGPKEHQNAVCLWPED